MSRSKPFSFGGLALTPEATGGAANPNNLGERDLKRAGLNFSSAEFPDDYMFSRMGGWNVTFRSSIIRITFFKLFGVGLAALFLSQSNYVGQYTSFSLALCAAVNFVACGHYWCVTTTRLTLSVFLLLTQSLRLAGTSGKCVCRPIAAASTKSGWPRWGALPGKTRAFWPRSWSTTAARSSSRRSPLTDSDIVTVSGFQPHLFYTFY